MSVEATRVLLAEDEPLLRILMVEALEDAGFEVIEAVDGVEACRLVKDPDHFAIVVTDLHMPNANGIEVAKCARALRPAMPILFVSARADMLASLPAPIPFHYLSKPFPMVELTEKVSAIVARGADPA